MDLSRRGFLVGLIAAPAILKLGIHMPVKPVLVLPPEPVIYRQITLSVPTEFVSIKDAMSYASRLVEDPGTFVTVAVGPGTYRLHDTMDARSNKIAMRPAA